MLKISSQKRFTAAQLLKMQFFQQQPLITPSTEGTKMMSPSLSPRGHNVSNTEDFNTYPTKMSFQKQNSLIAEYERLTDRRPEVPNQTVYTQNDSNAPLV